MMRIRESVMFKDRKIIYVAEYIIGFTLLIAVLPYVVRPHPGWDDGHWWAYLLFIVCSGFTLVSCASEMRQRMQLAERVSKLEQMTEEHKGAQMQSQNETCRKRTASDHLVGSVN
jgi:hypothetical protein